jgi:hypothetical protein
MTDFSAVLRNAGAFTHTEEKVAPGTRISKSKA